MNDKARVATDNGRTRVRSRIAIMERAQATAHPSTHIRTHRVWRRLGFIYDAVMTTGILLLVSIIVWDDWRSWARPQVLVPLLALVGVVWGGKVVLLRQLYRSTVEHMSIAIVWVIAVYAGLSLWLLLTRGYYSRSFLLVSFSLLIAWQVIDALLVRTYKRPLRLAAMPSELVSGLVGTPGLELSVMAQPQVRGAVDGIIIDMHEELPSEWTRFLAESSANGIPIYHAASIYEAATDRVALNYAHADWLREVFTGSAVYLPIKRAIDLLLVLISLPVVIPISLAVALIIRLTTPGPILFWQERTGEGGRPFWMVKFRSMRVDAEAGGAQFADRHDVRVTRVGRILRRYRLDELPQLWNVLKGDMSIIGPRPEQVKFAHEFAREIPFYHLRHCVKPGITGWAQVQQGYAAGVEDTVKKLEYDLYYVKHLSLWIDLAILFRTVRIVLTGFGAR